MTENTIFAFERLDCYNLALEYLDLATDAARGLPRSKGCLGDQLLRASQSIPLNIAEGVGLEAGSAEQQRHYRIARGSALECAAILDVAERSRVLSEKRRQEGRALLLRIVQMLSRLARRR